MAPQNEDLSISDQKRQDGSYPQTQAPVEAPPAISTSTATSPPGYEGRAVLDEKRQDGSRATPQASSPSSPPAIAGPSTAGPAEQIPSYDEATRSTGAVPTVDSPFNFPTTTQPPPSYEAHARAEANPSSSKQKPIAIPQLAPDDAAPFLAAYPPSLLAHGVTEQAWCSFLETVSAFLTAKVSDRAIAHAGDVGRSVSGLPVNYGKNLANHTISVGKQIAKEAKRFNVLGVVGGVIGGVISIPMHAVSGVVGTIFQIPATALAAAVKTPKTPLERAATYAAVASKDWLNSRGLHAVLLDTKQLAEMIHMSPNKFLEVASAGGKSSSSAAGTMCSLEQHVEKLKVLEEEVVLLNAKSLWLVLVPVVMEADESK
ncbi:hypothetical protein QQS21_011366 [Conoideocrella luteorostrata]|uniref:Uncharacterized protein n=1 Tax=Conoideocrella luteorostrata TaxID=1105319 RepID=A0AAJ0CFZ7_9HYPO|nr:hypothetical protein QQS21_011366 [Conoideocrella luteorostrata]